jgi:uncharacterized membrane protein YphA (DoxX/SURF4 family)
VTTAVSIALAFVFFAAGISKLLSVEASIQVRDHLGIGVMHWRTIGFLEVSGAVGVLVGLAVSALGAAAAAGLLLTSIGASATHLRAGDPPRAASVPGALAVLAAATFALQAF